MLSLLLAITFIAIFVIITIAGGNYVLRNMLNNILGNNEHFKNNDDKLIDNDECKKTDENNLKTLNFQTATNIPLSPNYYKNFIGSVYIDDRKKESAFDSELQKGKYCMGKPKLLYDGIWESNIKNDAPYETETWNLTDGNLVDGYYCSDKMVEVNHKIPDNYIDKSAVSDTPGGEYYTYFNDTCNDVFDTEVQCFPSVFNAGITEDLKSY